MGTQMIVKGHDFPNVTLVGVLAADMSLYSDDYRAGERTFQLLTQAVGRAGRGEKKGEAVIQTYSPEHYAVVTAAAQDYAAFYEEEIQYRSLMGYPRGKSAGSVCKRKRRGAFGNGMPVSERVCKTSMPGGSVKSGGDHRSRKSGDRKNKRRLSKSTLPQNGKI